MAFAECNGRMGRDRSQVISDGMGGDSLVIGFGAVMEDDSVWVYVRDAWSRQEAGRMMVVMTLY